MPWWQIIAILIVVALVVGVLSSVLGFSSSWSAPAIGAALGITAAALVGRRRRSE
jgi:membrane associated rhomboid family serine protease